MGKLIFSLEGQSELLGHLGGRQELGVVVAVGHRASPSVLISNLLKLYE